MLRTRLITADILLAIATLTMWLGSVPFAALMSVGFLIAGYEYLKMCKDAGYPLGTRFGLLLMAMLMLDGLLPELNLVKYVILALVVIPSLLGLVRPAPTGYLTGWSLLALGVLYIGGLGGYAFRVAILRDGLALLGFALGEAWITDTLAYFIGKRWGRRPFFQHVSPKKTWEGALAGLIVGAGSVAVLARLYGFPPLFVMVFTLTVALATTFGDLAESLLKRQLQLKDSGVILAGHGGMFDRLDSSFWALVGAYYCAVLLLPSL